MPNVIVFSCELSHFLPRTRYSQLGPFCCAKQLGKKKKTSSEMCPEGNQRMVARKGLEKKGVGQDTGTSFTGTKEVQVRGAFFSHEDPMS